MDELHRDLARRIRELADAKGITLTHVADFSGRSRSHFWNVMRGSNSPTVTWLASVAMGLGVEVCDLFSPGGALGEVLSLARRLRPTRLRALQEALRREARDRRTST